MSEVGHRGSRGMVAALAGMVLGALIWAAPAAGATAPDEQAGQEGQIWNLGTQQNGRTYPTTVSAHNKSCGGKRDFQVTVEGEAARFLKITGPTILEKIKRGETKTTDAVLDLVDAAPGVYDEGTVTVRCLNCPPRCHQDYTILQVNLTVVAPADAADTGSVDTAEPGGDPAGGLSTARHEEPPAGDGAATTGAVAPDTSTLRAFTDSDGTDWDYCSGRCTKKVETIRRADGTKSKVVRIKRGTCDADCSCVLFNYTGGKLVKKLEVEEGEDKGYLDIGQDAGADYVVRCCEED